MKVTLLLQERVEYRLLHYASRALYGHLLESGVAIAEYHRSFLHAKVAVIDDHWATVGSSNLDPLSLLLAREANVVVADRTFAQQLHRRLIRAIAAESVPVDRADYLRRPWHQRLRDRMAFGLMRLMLFLSGLRY